MSEKMAREIAAPILFLQVAEQQLNRSMLKCRHAPVELNQALTKLSEARALIIKASEIEAEYGDNYE